MLEQQGVKPGMSVDDFSNKVRSSFERAREERDRGDDGDRRRGEDGRGRTGNINQVNGSFRASEKKRVTLDLPPSYKEFDTDLDGQLGLYEWIVAKRQSLQQFDEIDADRDSLLTPLELKFYEDVLEAGKPRVVSYKQDRLLIVGPGGKKTGTGESSKGVDKKDWKGGKKLDKKEREKQLQTSRGYFTKMDKNGDGRVDVDELDKKRLVPWFEKAGIEVKGMSEEEFGEAFVTAIERTKK